MKIENTSIRLKQIMLEEHLKQVDILEKCKPYCKKYGITMNKSDISQYISGKTEPGSKKLTILALALGVTETWLMGYDVPMKTESSEKPNIEEKNEVLSEDIRRIARAHSKMPKEVQERFMTAVTASFQDYFSDDYEDTDTEE